MRLKQFAVSICLLLSFALNCSAQDSLKQTPGANNEIYLKTELFFGLDVNGKTLSRKKWDRFVEEYIAPKFETGFTILDADGCYYGSSGKFVQEHTKVMIIVHHPDKTIDDNIRYLIKTYRELYHQESVLRVESQLNYYTF